MDNENKELHPFERAGLGKAPFRAVGWAERVYQVAPGVPPRAAGCCKYCYTGIRYAVIVESSDGKQFDVGSDCIEKLDYKAYKEGMAHKRAAARLEWELHGKAEAEARRAREEQEERERAATEAAWRAANPELAPMIDLLDQLGGFPEKHAREVRWTVRTGEPIKFDDLQKLKSLYFEHTARGYAGTVGQRETFSATYLGRQTIDTQFGSVTFHKFASARPDGSHALLVWKTSSVLTIDGEPHYNRPSQGELVTFQATVKEHSRFRDIPQTMLTRVSKVRRAVKEA